jgi:hypoxanthine phosphoribosyltransferase
MKVESPDRFPHPFLEARMAPTGNIPLTALPGGVSQEVLEVSWELFGELCRALALRVYREYDPDVVVGIATAGVIPAAVIADILQVDFYSMKISRPTADARPELVSTAPPQAGGNRVLLVDEITTSGETMRLALAALRDVLPAQIRTATCFCRSGGFHPDFYTLPTDALIVFPWDRRVIEDGELVVHPTYRGVVEG